MAWYGSYMTGMSLPPMSSTLRWTSGSGQYMSLGSDGSLRMYNNGQSLNVSSTGLVSMNNNARSLSVRRDGFRMCNNTRCTNYSSGSSTRYPGSSRTHTNTYDCGSIYRFGSALSTNTRAYDTLPSSGSCSQSYLSYTPSTREEIYHHRVETSTPNGGPQDSINSTETTLRTLNSEIHSTAVVDSALQNLPTYVIDKEKEECCEICLDEVVTGDEIRVLPCCHQFHKDCVDPWLRKSTTCPSCRISILV